jgi:hypothetical protein
LIKFPKFDICGGPPHLSACAIHVWIGWLAAVVFIRVIVCRILLVRRHCGGSRAVSCSIAVIAVVRKHPVMARMILPCSDERVFSCDVVGAVLVSPGLCQIIAPYSILGAATASKVFEFGSPFALGYSCYCKCVFCSICNATLV